MEAQFSYPRKSFSTKTRQAAAVSSPAALPTPVFCKCDLYKLVLKRSPWKCHLLVPGLLPMLRVREETD
ncbi:hypothetical protein Y1Q_0010994 [Alligator mississippiensis]|uniref:Uncharacterized protein n=1 Tax=Alligator mississippiensis TaxID=8496 RepID=A0A151NLD2_ALLMI|nr:hypothetical protein Y1Q_0010994 [Alligator mississippiensis]